jgi:hypothetical protein
MALVECTYCHLSYDDSSRVERNIHARQHKKWQKAEETLHYLPRPYGQREAMKTVAHNLIQNGETEEQKIQGCMLLFRAHFDRSLFAAINKNYWKRHPTFEQYVTMMDYNESVVPKKIMKKIRKKYPYKKGHIAQYYSYWFSPNSKDRKQQFLQAEKDKKIQQFRLKQHKTLSA